VKAVQVRELDVEQDDVGLQVGYGRDRRRAVGRLANNVETRRLQQRTRRRSEGGVIIDDEDRPAHAVTVAKAASERIGAHP
jgi:hypothetical protein